MSDETDDQSPPPPAPLPDGEAAYRSGFVTFVGRPNVGKSSLVNQLVPDLELQTQVLSQSTGKGKHTTTSTMMNTNG